MRKRGSTRGGIELGRRLIELQARVARAIGSDFGREPTSDDRLVRRLQAAEADIADLKTRVDTLERGGR